MTETKFTKEDATFRYIVRRLENFWLQKGCVILPGWDKPVGAGTLAPHTAMRLISPEPWKCAYLQPCRRPLDEIDDTHTQRHHQFQVLLKPAPDNPLDLVRECFGPTDLAFMEDTWESPIIGASGKGWEVSVRGVEVAQITIFNRVGRRVCEPALEIAIGLERAAMLAQRVDTIPEIHYDANHLYGDIYPAADEASGDLYNRKSSQIRQLGQELQNRLKHQNARGLAFYENILEVSNLINLLDARGALSVEAKTHFIRRSCDLMEQLVVGEFEEIPEQPFHQIYHPQLGLTQKHEARAFVLGEWYGRGVAAHLARLVGLWGVGERATGDGDPYRLEESALAFQGLGAVELSLALTRAAHLYRDHENFSADLGELQAFILDAFAPKKPNRKGRKQ